MTLGIVRSLADKAKFVGEDPYGYGYCPGDGNVYHNGISVASLDTATFGDYILVLFDPKESTLVFYKNGATMGSPIIVVSSSAGSFDWTFAGTVSGEAGDMALKIYPGNPPMRYPSGNLAWWRSVQGIAPILVATEPYMSASTDTPAHEKYAGDLDNSSKSLAISESVHIWPWGASAPAELGSGGLVQF